MQSMNTKQTGDTLTANEFNQFASETQGIIVAAAIALSGGDVDQMGKALAQFYAGGGFWVESGVANAYVANPVGSQQLPPALTDGMRIVIRPGNANTTASTLNAASLGVKSILREDGTALSAGDLGVGRDAVLRYNLSTDKWFLAFASLLQSAPDFSTPSGYIDGLVTSNSGVDSQHDIVVGEGVARNTLPTGSKNTKTLTNSADLTKKIDATWADGNNAGGRAAGVALSASSWYHVFAIGTSGNGVFDVGFDTSVTAANLTLDAAVLAWVAINGGGIPVFRRIGAVQTNGSANIYGYTQYQNKFLWDDRVQRVELVPTTTNDYLVGSGGKGELPMRVPLGIKAEWIGIASYFSDSSNNHYRAMFGSPDMPTLAAVTAGNADIDMWFGTGQFSDWTVNEWVHVHTNTSQEIRLRVDRTHASVSMRFMGWGWIDPRDKE